MRSFSPVQFLLLLLSVLPCAAGVVVWDGGGDGTNWHHAPNWSGDIVPGAADDAVIDLPGTNATITLTNGSVSLRSLQCEESFVIAGGALTLTAGASHVNGSLTLARLTSLTVRGSNTTFAANGTAAADGAGLFVAEGASLALPGLGSYTDTGGCCGRRWEVQGRDSRLSLPGLTNLTGNPVPQWPLELRALAGGRLELTNLAAIPGGGAGVLADGTNSWVGLSSLQTVNANLLSLDARSGAAILVPQLTDGSRVVLSMRAGSSVPTTQFTRLHSVTADGAAIDLGGVTGLTPQGAVTLRNGGTVNLNGVTNLDGLNLYSLGGTTLSFPGAPTYADTAGCCGTTWEARGAGSRISLPALTHFTGNPVPQWPTDLRVFAGGRIELTNLTAIPAGAANVLADGTNSVADFSALQTVNANLLALEARNGGAILIPQLTAAGNVILTLRRGGQIPVAQLTSLHTVTADGLFVDLPALTRLTTRGEVTLLNGGGANLGAVTNVDGLSFFVRAGATLTLPSVSNYTDTSGCCGAVWEANGAGAVLSLPGLTNLTGNPTWAMIVRSLAGGAVNLPALAIVRDSQTSVLAEGSNSVVRLPNLMEFRGVNGSLSLTAQSRGSIETPSLTRLNRGRLTLATSGRLEVPQLTAIDGSSFFVRAGEQLVLSNVTAFADTSGCCGAEWEAGGAGALLSLPALTQLAGNPTWAMSIRSLNDGAVDLHSVLAIPDRHLDLLADGTNSVVRLTSLPEFRGVNGSLLLTARNRGRIETPNLIRLNRGRLTLATRGRLEVPQLANIDGSSLFVNAGEQLTLSNVTAFADTSGCCGAEWEASGSGAVLNLPSLTQLTGNPTWTMAIRALTGGMADLSTVLTLADSNTSVLADGTNSVVDLSQLAQFQGSNGQLSLEARNHGVIRLDALTRLTRARLTLRHPGFMPTDQLRVLVNSSAAIDGLAARFTSLTDMRGTTFTYTNGGTAVFTPPADLVVADIQAPGATIAGQPVQLVWTVANLAANPAPGPRHDAVFLSTDATVGSDQLLAQFPVTDGVPAGGAQTVTNTVILPAGITGNRFFIVQADAAFEVFEGTNEANNVRVAGQPVITSAADLVLDEVSVPVTNALFGQTIPVTWRVRNAGSVPAGAPWSDRLFLSTNTAVSPGAVSLAIVPAANHVPLAAGASYTRTQTVALPLSGALAPGPWFVVVRTDASGLQAESNEGNNTRASGAIPMQRPPLPDLAVAAITAPAVAAPGQTVSVSWVITNQGAAAVTGVWNETLLLSTDTAPGADLAVGFFAFTNTLPPGAAVTRTQSMILPVTGPAGMLRFGAEVDSQQAVVESDEANNLAFAGESTEVPATLTLALPVTQIAENATNPFLRTQVSRNGDLGAALEVSIAVDDPTELAAPLTVTLPPNVAATSFELQALADGQADGPQTVAVLAAAPGYAPASNAVVVLDADVPGLTLLVDGAALVEGGSAAASVTRAGDLSTALTVTIASSSAGQLNTPGTVVIPAGEPTAAFTVLAVDDYYVEAGRSYTLTASAPGHTSSFAVVTVQDDDLPALALALDTTRVGEGAGPAAATLTIARDFDTVAPLTVRITRSPADQLTGAEEVTFAAGEFVKAVPLSPVDDALIDGPQPVLLTVQALETLSLSPIAPGVSTNLTVLDDDGPALQLALSRDWLCAGASNAALGTLTANIVRRGETNSHITVALNVNPPGLVTIPATVDLGPGETMAPFTVSALAATVTERQALTLTATAAGFAEASVDLAFVPECGPDLVIRNLTVPANGLTDETFSVSFREQNLGAAFAVGSEPPAVPSLAQQIFLSPDPYPGGDTFLGAVLFNGTVDPYTFLDRSATFRLPSTPGDYWVIVQADGSNNVVEVSEANNFAVAAAPIRVEAAYTATVTASPDVALAGTPVVLSGIARKSDTAEPAPFAIVSLHVGLRGTTRVIAGLTDANGQYSATFTPLPGEAGTYTVAAAHPGVTNPPAQTTFTLLGMKATPATLAVRVPAFTTVTQLVSLANLGDVPLGGLTTSVIGAPAEFNVATEVPPALPPFATDGLSLTLGVGTDTNLTRTFTVRVTSVEGAVADVIVTLMAESLRPRLVVTPESLVAGVAPGGQRFVEFSVANEGGAPTEPLQVLLPPLPFLRLASPSPLPPLAPGESNLVTLQLAPAPGAALGDYPGSLFVSGGAAGVSVPFSFRVLSTNSGALRVEVTDQFTYYAEGAPRVTNALVELRDPATGSTVANLLSDAQGIVRFTNVTEGYYVLHVTAAEHQPYRRNIFVGAGSETYHEALLNREVVQFVWNVVPTEIGDRTRITIEAVFETVVPLPVVTVHPPVIDLADFPNGGTINLTVTNHGLLAAQDVRMFFSDFDCWKITPLISDLGTLAARSAMVVPVSICRDLGCAGNFTGCTGGGGGGAESAVEEAGDKNREVKQVLARVANAEAAESGGGGSDCGGGALVYVVPCGDGAVGGSAPVGVANAGGEGCGWHPAGGGGGGFGSLAGGSAAGGAPCDPCALARLKAIVKCAIKFIPLPDWAKCVKAAYECGAGLDEGPSWGDAYKCTKAALTCAKASGKSIPWLKYLKYLECTYDILTACNDLESGGGGGAPEGLGPAAARLAESSGPPPFVTAPELYPLYVRAERLSRVAAFNEYLFGSNQWFQDEDTNVWDNWLGVFLSGIETNTPAGERIDAAERAALLALPLPFGVAPEEAARFLDRWNRSLDYWQAGIFNRAQVPAGQSTDFIAVDQFLALSSAASEAVLASEAEGYPSLADGLEAAKFDLQTYSSQPSDGICARVRLRIDQEAVIARDAFRATLEIANLSGSPLTNVAVDVVVYGPGGQVATELFAIPAPALSGLGAVDGTGWVEAGTTATAAWNILPTVEAAPVAPVEYYVGGSIRYTQDGVAITVPLALVAITVHPLAQLQLTYFHQRDVLGDDPFTDEIEPSVPYALAVMVRNTGNGTARNLRITSAQPQIVENEKGLFIDFRIIATEVAGRNLVPSLTANFGDVPPGALAIGQWLFQSSLQGLFIDYSATFEHLDNLGDPRLSLIQSADIRELIRIVRAPGGFEDGLPDLLVNDFPDLEDLPDTLYLSGGAVEPVSIVQTGAVTGALSPGNLSVTVQAPLPAGWSYLRIMDPADGRYRLAAVLRPDGSRLSVGTNVWTSDRTFVGGGRRPVKEHRLHLLDYDSPGVYTLVYEPLAGPDTTPPASRVAALPLVSGESIPVTWSGEDNAGGAGIAFYDVFVSANGGQFVPWLEQTLLAGSLYDGAQGNTYAFYSVATDLAGNREASPFAPDAITGVNFTNTPPLLADALVAADEGTTVRYTNVVVDPDVPPQSLSFSLLGTAPAGATLHPVTGVLTWPTSEATGPATNVFLVRVADNGFPNFHATGAVTVVVREVNRPPTLAAIAGRTIREGQVLAITNAAGDPDLPANRLVFSLGPGAPAGATIDPASGVFRWQPAEFQGGTTNPIAVIVADDGQPSLSATQRFTVVVRDTLGDFELSLGSTHVLVGGSNAVPVRLNSGIELARLDFVLEFSEASLGNLTLRDPGPEIVSLLLLPVGPDRAAISFDFNPALAQSGVRPLSLLGFQAVPGGESAIVPLQVTQLSGVRSDGQAVARVASRDGRVFVIGTRPLLAADRLTNGHLGLTLYGQPGRTYAVEPAADLDGAPWQTGWNWLLTNAVQSFDAGGPTNRMQFWRAREP